MEALLLVLGAALVVVGAAGTILPALPGVPLVFAGLLVAAASDGFTRVGWPSLTLMALLAATSFAVDALATALGARRVGASRLALVGAFVGSIAGLFLGLPGLVLGPFVGAFGGEWLARRDLAGAGRVGVGTWLGLVASAAAKIAIVFAMVGLFAAAWIL